MTVESEDLVLPELTSEWYEEARKFHLYPIHPRCVFQDNPYVAMCGHVQVGYNSLDVTGDRCSVCKSKQSEITSWTKCQKCGDTL